VYLLALRIGLSALAAAKRASESPRVLGNRERKLLAVLVENQRVRGKQGESGLRRPADCLSAMFSEGGSRSRYFCSTPRVIDVKNADAMIG
jgi:hypothetical protein